MKIKKGQDCSIRLKKIHRFKKGQEDSRMLKNVEEGSKRFKEI